MKMALVFLTDQGGLALTEYALAVALLTQRSAHHMIVFCVDFLPVVNEALTSEASRRGLVLDYRCIAREDGPDVSYSATGAHSHVSFVTLLKMAALDAVSKEFDRAVYLDGDILLMDDFNQARIDFAGATVAAVYDIAKSGALSTEIDFYKRCKERDRSHHYFNAGFIAVEFSRWSSEIVSRYNQAVQDHSRGCDYQSECSCCDQCAWNRTFERHWKRLPLTMNLQACAMFTDRWTYATVRHYTGPMKFIPFRAWRNDARDKKLINDAAKLLGVRSRGFPFASAFRTVNAIRNRSSKDEIYAAINRLEVMLSEHM